MKEKHTDGVKRHRNPVQPFNKIIIFGLMCYEHNMIIFKPRCVLRESSFMSAPKYIKQRIQQYGIQIKV